MHAQPPGPAPAPHAGANGGVEHRTGAAGAAGPDFRALFEAAPGLYLKLRADLTAESTPGVGSTFTLTLPRA